jgi:hypothetical protein
MKGKLHDGAWNVTLLPLRQSIMAELAKSFLRQVTYMWKTAWLIISRNITFPIRLQAYYTFVGSYVIVPAENFVRSLYGCRQNSKFV